MQWFIFLTSCYVNEAIDQIRSRYLCRIYASRRQFFTNVICYSIKTHNISVRKSISFGLFKVALPARKKAWKLYVDFNTFDRIFSVVLHFSTPFQWSRGQRLCLKIQISAKRARESCSGSALCSFRRLIHLIGLPGFISYSFIYEVSRY